jgi:hypothetical protein
MNKRLRFGGFMQISGRKFGGFMQFEGEKFGGEFIITYICTENQLIME